MRPSLWATRRLVCPVPKHALGLAAEGTAMDNPDEETDGLLRSVAQAYRLGRVSSWRAASLAATANHVIRLCTTEGAFAVKVFQYTVTDDRWLTALHRAGEFELSVWESAHLQMPEPVRNDRGEIFDTVPSRAGRTLVRVHRWLDGSPLALPQSKADAAAAGALLHRIQRLGALEGEAHSGALRWWRWDPHSVLDRLMAEGAVTPEVRDSGRETLTDAWELIRGAEHCAGSWWLSHYDFKPANCLLASNALSVLDWDEAAMCPPRQEAVESALLWAGYEEGECRRETFVAFLDGYQAAGGPLLGGLERSDFGKFIASAVGWFDYLGRCRVDGFPEARFVKDRPNPGAVLADVRQRLDRIDTWRSWRR